MNKILKICGAILIVVTVFCGMPSLVVYLLLRTMSMLHAMVDSNNRDMIRIIGFFIRDYVDNVIVS